MKQLVDLFTQLSALAERVGRAMHWLSPSLARFAVGMVFVQSGWGKVHDLASVTEYFTQLGLPAPAFQALLASSTELVCGALLLLGLATRLAAVPLIVTMIVAIRTALWDQVDGLTSVFGLAEFLYIALLVWLATDGPGPLSADALLARKESAPTAILPCATSRALP